MAGRKGNKFYVTSPEFIQKYFATESERDQFLHENPTWIKGRKLSDEVKKRMRDKFKNSDRNKKISEKLKGNKNGKFCKGIRKFYANNGSTQKYFKTEDERSEFLRNNPDFHKGQLVTQETKDKISKTNSGRKRTEEVKRAQSKRRTGVPNIKARGKKRSEESKKKMSESAKNKFKNNPELINQISEKLTGRKLPQSQIDNIRSGLDRARKANPELTYRSKKEKHVFSYLNSYFICHSNFFIKGYNHPYDYHIILPDGTEILGEFDGKYWHKDEDYDNDLRRINAEDAGYKYFVIKEIDYNSKGGLKYVKSMIAEFYPELMNFSLSRAEEIKSELYDNKWNKSA